MKPHHIGYLVKNMEKSVLQMEFLGYKTETPVVYDPSRKIDICFMINGGYRIELIVSKDDSSVVAGLSKKMKATPYHICYETDSIEKTGKLLRGKGYVPMGSATVAPALDGHLAAFFYHREIGIIELVEVQLV